MKQTEAAPDRRSAGRRFSPPGRIEWILGIASALVVAAMIGYLVRDAVLVPNGPPILEVRVLGIEPDGSGQHRVRFEIANRGGSTAADVVVQGRLVGGGGPAEDARITVDYVPRSSTRRGALLFAGDPETGALALRAEAYNEP